MASMNSMILGPLLETLKGLFADKLIDDDREPIVTFELPFVEQTQGSVWALYPPKLHLWHQLIMVSLLFVVCCLWFVVCGLLMALLVPYVGRKRE
jgi:hypothetical protein